jgi:hypothetical protein
VVRAFHRRAGSVAYFCAALVLVPLLFYANVLYWHGDPAWGPRYLYTSLPYLTLPLGEALVRWPRLHLSARAGVLLLVAAGLGLSLAAVSVTQWRFWYRLEVQEQQTVNASQWTGQPFHWGSQRYHYYWNVRQSPILMQVDDVYQVARLDVLGDTRYKLSARPDPYVSNPADNYPVNSPNFWWADVRHPLLGARTRYAIALLLAACAAMSLAGLGRLLQLGVPRTRAERTPYGASAPGQAVS